MPDPTPPLHLPPLLDEAEGEGASAGCVVGGCKVLLAAGCLGVSNVASTAAVAGMVAHVAVGVGGVALQEGPCQALLLPASQYAPWRRCLSPLERSPAHRWVATAGGEACKLAAAAVAMGALRPGSSNAAKPLRCLLPVRRRPAAGCGGGLAMVSLSQGCQGSNLEHCIACMLCPIAHSHCDVSMRKRRCAVLLRSYHGRH